MVWRGAHVMVFPGGHRKVYGMAWQASQVYCMTWHGAWHGIWYGLAGMACYMVWPGGHGMVYGLAWREYYGIWSGLAGTVWCMVWPGGPRMVYCMTCRASHGIMVWPGMASRHHMVFWYSLVWDMIMPAKLYHSMAWRACRLNGTT